METSKNEPYKKRLWEKGHFEKTQTYKKRSVSNVYTDDQTSAAMTPQITRIQANFVALKLCLINLTSPSMNYIVALWTREMQNTQQNENHKQQEED